jgi:pyruvate carboxylase subunit A
MSIEKILVANRGEIALRIMRACRELQLKSVGVFSDVDQTGLHVKYADESYYLGPPEPSLSYLNVEKIIDIAISSGCDAIHPGYGFLSENDRFAEACEKNKIKFIGPSSDTLRRTGNKFEAKKAVSQQGIAVIPGSESPCRDFSEALSVAERIGWPVLIKSVYGGGGRGIRTACNKRDLELNFASAEREAKASFGRFAIYIEKKLVRPRHVEFQILCDEHGGRIHLGERECSIQRRFQKLLELCPSPIIDYRMRDEIGRRATKIARTFNYENAGTVEFLYSEGEFYFIEVNSRLQVEHPITEMVTGVDLVKEQIRIASEEELTLEQECLSMRGWAIECRINAEDPANDFSPSSGRISYYQQPAGPGIRVDTALYEGYEVTFFYDSLIAKLIAWGRDLNETLARVRNALSEFVIEGVKTTIPFHRVLLEDAEFRRMNLSTNFIEDRDLIAKVTLREDETGSEIEEVGALALPLLRKNLSRPTVFAKESTAYAGGVSRWKDFGNGTMSSFVLGATSRFPDVI